jgi:hypothetical protein
MYIAFRVFMLDARMEGQRDAAVPLCNRSGLLERAYGRFCFGFLLPHLKSSLGLH